MRTKPPHQPTDAQRQTVQLHATVGTRHDVIADIIGIDPKTLRKHYREELDQAMAKANATIGGALFNKAKAGDTAAQIFWMKTRAEWRETNRTEHVSPDGSMSAGPVSFVIEGVKPDDADQA
jgi:hypothetical protein